MTKLVDKPLTELQKKFANLYVQAFYGNEYLSNTEVAIKAGYSADSAYQRAYELEKGMYGIALRGEELRGKVAGYYIDRQIIKNKGIEDMSEEQLHEEMKKIETDYKHILNPVKREEKLNGKRKK